MPAAIIDILTNPWGIFLLVLIGTACGWFVHAAAPRPDQGLGLMGVMVRGFVGTLAGLWVAALVGLPDVFVLNFGGLAFPVLWALVGGIIFMMVFRILRI